MPKRLSSERDRGRTAKRRRRRHLYLVFDDSWRGYSIRKVDLSSASDPDSDSDNSEEPPHQRAAISETGAELRLPPALFRLEAPRGLPHYFAAAFGTRIMAMHPMKPGTDGKLCLMSNVLAPVFDVRTGGVIFAPRHEADLADPIYIRVRDRLFVLASGSFEQLWPPPLEHAGGERWVWTWQALPKPPFKRKRITCYAVRPDGSIVVGTDSGATAATFTFDTEARYFVWKKLGNWALPFTGLAHFDCQLDAFVGLSKGTDTLGHLCSCDMPSSDTGDEHCLPPAWKLSKEKLFNEDPDEKHEGATLLYMGGRSRFCLVECISIEDDLLDEEVQEQDVPRPCHHLLRLTMFSLNYDKNGDLTTGKSRRVRHYKVPKASTEFLLRNPVAFWL